MLSRSIHLQETVDASISCSPYPLHRLRHTNIVRLKLVEAHGNRQCCYIKTPHEQFPRLRQSPARDIVYDYGSERMSMLVFDCGEIANVLKSNVGM